MKLTFGSQELKIRDYFDTTDFQDKRRRITATLEDSSMDVDSLKSLVDQNFIGSFTITDNGNTESETFENFSAFEITKNRDDSSTRLSLTFEKE